MAGELTKETKILEYWRKRYLVQAGIVGGLAVAAGIAAGIYADFWLLKVFFCLLAATIFYVMYKSLRESLQVRGEGLILAKGEELFGEVMFDVGRGLCENALLAQEISPPYQVRECDNVMRGKGYWFEEDWFYSVLSSKYIPINQTSFQGMVCAFADTLCEEELKGEIILKNGKAVVIGEIASHLKLTGAVEIVVALMQLFKVEKVKLATADKTLYVWIATEKKLFYQFSLLKPNTLTMFQRRITRLKELAENMLMKLND